jgi:isoleucyl-tRNA synthetase
LQTPADIYLEGSDQHRGWFQTSLLSALATKGKAPFKALVTHGFVVDAKGLKMSKSKGNAIDPHEVIKKSGAEILRLWVSYEDYGQDIGFGQEALARVTETYRKFRNTLRFLLGNIGDFNPQTDLVEVSKMTVLDRYAMHQLNELIKKTTVAYDNYDFYKVHHLLSNFFTVELSAGYLDMLKDRLYTWKKDGAERRSSQTVLFHMLDALVRIMAPITTFLAEAESVFLLDYPKANAKWEADDVANELAKLFEIRKDVSKILEDLRRDKTIGSGLDARILITADGEQQGLLKKYQGLLTEFFIVSQVHLQVGQYSIQAQKADGEKCERCWYYDVNIGKDPRFPTCCPKCLKALG